ncbi:AAA family ATPase [Ralstonia solanacearum]|uniref:AAA family ATPase n=3 Tax=Ralstonia pseudosolanacearum TaxID=1310165 RepID=UPI001BDBC07E|nr:ATP-binding protein [Ralstonia solanacearum]
MARSGSGSEWHGSNAIVDNLLQRIRASTAKQGKGRVTYLIGDNGTGKSRILAKLAELLQQERPTWTVACISNSIYDRFNQRDIGRVRYLGARNSPNAVFHAAIDRQLSRIILQAMLVDRKSMAELSAAIGLRFSFGLRLQTSDELEKLIDMNKRRRQARADLLTPRSLSMLARISKAGGAFEKLTEPQIRVFLRYLELNIDFDLYVRLPDDRVMQFEDLSTGEQNRTLLFAKILSAAQERSVFLIDEPEVSLHLHWQMGFHGTLMQLLSRLKRFHVVVATHAPIVISEAAKLYPKDESNGVAVLRRSVNDGHELGKHSPGWAPVDYKIHTFAEVASHEQLVLRYFQAAPYHAHGVGLDIADTVLNVLEGRMSKVMATRRLLELGDAVGLTQEAKGHIDSAVDLIKRNVVRRLEAQN